MILKDKRGVVYIELLMSLMPVLLAFLGVCQFAILYMAQLVVQHAATRAARAAMVVMEDDPAAYDDAARGSLTDGEASGEMGVPPEKLGDAESIELFGISKSESSDGARLAAIRAAAYHPLAVLGPSPSYLLHKTLESELAKDPWLRILGGRFLYNLGAASITVHRPGSDEVLTQVGKYDPIEIRVAFLMPCAVPLVSTLMCIGQGPPLLDSIGLGNDDEAEAMRKAMEHVESTTARDLIWLAIPRLTLLTAQAIMPNQGANYY